VRHFHKIEIGNRAQQIAWGFADLLSMQQVARILIRDPMAQRIEPRSEAEVRKKLSDVARLRGERAGLRMFGLACRKKMMVFLHCGAATGGICDNGVKIVQPERRQVLSCEI